MNRFRLAELARSGVLEKEAIQPVFLEAVGQQARMQGISAPRFLS